MGINNCTDKFAFAYIFIYKFKATLTLEQYIFIDSKHKILIYCTCNDALRAFGVSFKIGSPL